MSEFQWERVQRRSPRPGTKFVTYVDKIDRGKRQHHTRRLYISSALRPELPDKVEVYTDPANKAIKIQRGTSNTGYTISSAGAINVILPMPAGRYIQTTDPSGLVFQLED